MTGSNERSQAFRSESLRAIGAFAASPHKCGISPFPVGWFITVTQPGAPAPLVWSTLH